MPADIVNATVIAASVTAFVGAFVSPLVAAWIGSRSRTHEARVKIATEARLRLLDRQINDVGDLRQRIRSVQAELHRFANEAYFNGVTDETIRLVRSCRDLVRATAAAGPFVPPDVLEESEMVIQELEEAINQIAEWSKLEKGARFAAASKTNALIQGTAAKSRAIFGRFQRELLSDHDRTLGLNAGQSARSGSATVERPAQPAVRVDASPVEQVPIAVGDEEEIGNADGISAVRRTPPKESGG